MKSRKKRSKIWEISLSEFSEIVKSNNTLADILRLLGLSAQAGNYKTLKKRLNDENVDYSHISLGLSARKGKNIARRKKYSIEEALSVNSTYSRNTLKKRILTNNLIDNKCYCCGIGPIWNNKKLSLQLDHINGISNDNRLENLRFLCPNCHSQTETFSGKNKK